MRHKNRRSLLWRQSWSGLRKTVPWLESLFTIFFSCYCKLIKHSHSEAPVEWEYAHLSRLASMGHLPFSFNVPSQESFTKAEASSDSQADTAFSEATSQSLSDQLSKRTKQRAWVEGICTLCGPTTTPVFRKDKSKPDSSGRVCNACSMYIRRKDRPNSSGWWCITHSVHPWYLYILINQAGPLT